MNVEIIKNEFGHLTIKINTLIHLKFMCKINAIHSYIDERTSPFNPFDFAANVEKYKMYYINFHLDSGQTVHCEYNDRELWEKILYGLQND